MIATLSMKPSSFFVAAHGAAVLCLGIAGAANAGDWPQYRGLNHDGVSTDRILKTWNTNTPGFFVWRNTALTNGFSCFSISQGRAFTQISRNVSGMKELCVGLDLATGAQLWERVVDTAPWSTTSAGDGGDGKAPCNTGDGPRTTPAVKDGRVYVLTAQLKFLCLNATNGAVVWSNNLVTAYGASECNSWNNGASPRLDDDLIFVSLNTASSGLTLAAFRTTNGAIAWRTTGENATQSTPVVATIEGVRQVLFATATGIFALDRSTGAELWNYPYPFYNYPTALAASPVVYSNMVFCAAGYGRGSAAARITKAGSTWTATHVWFKSSNGGVSYNSTWMTPVVVDGYIYGQFGYQTTQDVYTNAPLVCIRLSDGIKMWHTNNFGMGGTILVDGALLTATTDGLLVLSQPNPTAYTELARCRAFSFTAAAPGKCWNSAAVADGRIYLRSTRGGVAINVAATSTNIGALKMLPPQRAAGNQLTLWIGTTNGAAIDSARMAKMSVRATANPAVPLGSWSTLTNALVLVGGQVRVDDVVSGGTRYFIAVEQP